jgi:hypothetical protein
MIERRTRLTAAALLIAMPIIFYVFFALLQSAFEYPDILRRPPMRCCVASLRVGNG